MTDFVRPCTDAAFKHIFADPADTAPLRSFLAAVLGWPENQLADLTIENPHLNPSRADTKESILDVRVQTTAGDSIDIEIQLLPDPGFPERLTFYTARLLANQLHRGQDYTRLRRTICVGITDFALIPDGHYHHRFRLHDPARQTELTNIIQIDLLEIPKLPADNDKTLLWSWMRFIGAHNQKEIDMTITADPAIAQAAGKAKFFTAEEQAEIDQLRQDIWMMEQVDRQRYAREDGIKEGLAQGEALGARQNQLETAQRMIAKGMPLETIADLTQLSLDEVAGLV